MTYDIAIVGGGLVGNTLACALGDQGFSVAVVEARDPMPEPDDSLSPRVSALTRASERILSALQVWSTIPPRHIAPYRQMHVWNTPGFGEIHFDAAQIAEPSLGHIVENDRLQYALTLRLQSLESVSIYQPARLQALRVDDSGVLLTLDQTTVEARLVVGADGGRSQVRSLAGIKTANGEYGQRAVVSIVRCENGHRDTAWQRFLDTGPLAVLPLRGDNACVVWSTTPSHAENLAMMDNRGFDEALYSVLGGMLGRLTSVGLRQSFSLSWLKSDEYVRNRLALIGDAAHTIHPLAGQGVNLGMYDAGVLSQIIIEADARGRKFFERPVLRRYERWRRGHNLIMHSVMNGLLRLFSNDVAGIRSLRNTGLAATNRFEPVKRAIMRNASGLTGDLPEIARRVRKSY